MAKPTKKEAPWSGRMAYICNKCEPPRPRIFLKQGDPVPCCDTHGEMERQHNNPYKGKSTQR